VAGNAIASIIGFALAISALSIAVFPAFASPAAEGWNPSSDAPEQTPIYSYEIVRSYPHDDDAFTEGLCFYDGFLYEGTGLYGESSLRKVDLDSGKVLNEHSLPSWHFGEGIAIWNCQVFQLTWRSRVGFVYDLENFTEVKNFMYSTEGWGLTSDGQSLIMSDGTNVLYILDPETLNVTGQIDVRSNGVPVTSLNELEYVKGQIYANVWGTDRIAMISPETGNVTGWICLEGLLRSEERSSKTDVLNGIAYDQDEDRLFVTGKFWPMLFQIKLILSAQA